MSFVRDHYECYDAPAPGRPAAPRHRRHTVPPAARPRARHPLGGLRAAPSARSSSGLGVTRVVAWARCRWRCRTPGRSRSPTHANRPELIPGAQPVARRAARSRAAPSRCSRCGWGSGATTCWASSRTSRTTSPSSTTPGAAASCSSTSSSAGRLTIDLTELHGAAEERETEIDALPRRQRGGRRRGRRPWSSSTTPSSAPRSPAPACWPRTSRCPPARRSARQFEQFLAGLDAQTADRTSPDSEVDSCPVAADLLDLLDLEDLDVDLFRGASPTPGGSGSSAGRWPPRRWSPGPHRGRRSSSLALAPLLLPAARRHGGADHLRRRADPRRPLVR